MFFRYDVTDPGERYGGLPWDPFKAIVAPRPIGWISTLSRDGVVNLAPYSYFNAISDKPNQVYFSSSTRKDSQRNAEETGEFVCNLASYPLREQMNITSAEVDRSEPELAGLEMMPSGVVKTPRVALAPAALECVYLDTYTCKARDGRPAGHDLVFGEVVAVYVDDAYVGADGRVDSGAMQAAARLGYDEYTAVDRVFRMVRPDRSMFEFIA
ncbi:MAG: flavin reductase family protein [Actinobacteria bacterium]|nr:flavin reductase family protein [Actinomycetota bacterium]